MGENDKITWKTPHVDLSWCKMIRPGGRSPYDEAARDCKAHRDAAKAAKGKEASRG